MMKLSGPLYTYAYTLAECISGISRNRILKQNLTNNKGVLEQSEAEYVQAAGDGILYKIPPIETSQNDNPVVMAGLKKSDFTKLYERYFRLEEKPGRKIYDQLLNAAKEECPYCGGVGRPRNLDHYLPIAHFPQFAVVPINLIPACRDCNMDGDNDGFATHPNNQIIHPFLDNDRFFKEQWVFGVFRGASDNQSDTIEYVANPPRHWPIVDIQRAKNHFKDFDLSKRYSIKAAQRLGTTISQIRKMRANGVGDPGIAEMLLLPAVDAAPFTNHWQRGMYQALIDSLPNIV